MSIHRQQLRLLLPALLIFQILSGFASAQGNRKFERVLIEIPKPYDRIVAAIRARGGRVTHQYKHIDGIAAEIPADAAEAIRLLVGPTSMSKDIKVDAPRPTPAAQGNIHRGQVGGVVVNRTQSRRPFSRPQVTVPNCTPDLYSLNNANTRIECLQERGATGSGTVVAVIDSGLRTGFDDFLGPGTGWLAGGIDFVGDGNGFIHADNDGHGTFIAGLITGNSEFELTPELFDRVEFHAPDALLPNDRLPIVGTAPSAQIYAVRVFGETATGGTNLSVILAAIEHVIDLRQDFDRGAPGGKKIDVANLSFGVTTLYAGRTLLDRLVDKMLDSGIVPVVSVGNTGPSAMTAASPGSSMSAVTVGGLSMVPNDRIFNALLDYQFDPSYGPESGLDWRPTDHTQTAAFSARGPLASGRLDPDVAVSGVANFSQGYCLEDGASTCSGDVALASGTSFAAPIVSGIAATLRAANPQVSATEIRNAIIGTARVRDGATVLIDNSSAPIDRGRGFPDAWAAHNLLRFGRVPDRIPNEGAGTKDVERNIERALDITVRSGDWTETFTDLKPGQRGEVFYRVEPGTAKVTVQVTNVILGEEQNVILGDAVFFNVHSAKTSAIGAFGDYEASAFLFEDDEFEVDYPDTGIMRITLSGDTINASNVSATVRVFSEQEAISRVSLRGSIRDEEMKWFTFDVPAGTQDLDLLLTWTDDWGNYPTSDVDVKLYSPTNAVNSDGATLAGPERVHIDNPAAGTWTMLVDGFEVPARVDSFEVRLLLDGVTVPGRKISVLK